MANVIYLFMKGKLVYNIKDLIGMDVFRQIGWCCGWGLFAWQVEKWIFPKVASFYENVNVDVNPSCD